jgi:hypothetical protein
MDSHVLYISILYPVFPFKKHLMLSSAQYAIHQYQRKSLFTMNATYNSDVISDIPMC